MSGHDGWMLRYLTSLTGQMKEYFGASGEPEDLRDIFQFRHYYSVFLRLI